MLSIPDETQSTAFSSNVPRTKFVKYFDLATKDEFRNARIQLCKAIKKTGALCFPPYSKQSGYRWTEVQKIMYSEKYGELKAYNKYGEHRNFRKGLVEKVFEKVKEMKYKYECNGFSVPDDITDLFEIAKQWEPMSKLAGEKKKTFKRLKEKEMKYVSENANNSAPDGNVDIFKKVDQWKQLSNQAKEMAYEKSKRFQKKPKQKQFELENLSGFQSSTRVTSTSDSRANHHNDISPVSKDDDVVNNIYNDSNSESLGENANAKRKRNEFTDLLTKMSKKHHVTESNVPSSTSIQSAEPDGDVLDGTSPGKVTSMSDFLPNHQTFISLTPTDDFVADDYNDDNSKTLEGTTITNKNIQESTESVTKRPKHNNVAESNLPSDNYIHLIKPNRNIHVDTSPAKSTNNESNSEMLGGTANTNIIRRGSTESCQHTPELSQFTEPNHTSVNHIQYANLGSMNVDTSLNKIHLELKGLSSAIKHANKQAAVVASECSKSRQLKSLAESLDKLKSNGFYTTNLEKKIHDLIESL